MAIFDPILHALGYLLSLFYALPPHNLGVAIILLTFAIMGALYPLTAKQARSMIAMQMVQPEIKRIQAKYKHDKAKLNEEMMAFYQENKINPLAGCLPLLVQMPIFFALFRTLRDPYEYVPVSSKLYAYLCTLPGQADPVTVKQCGNLDGLPRPTYFLSMNLSLAAPKQEMLVAQVLAFALVVLVMFTGYMQSRQAQKRTPAINKQMATITKVLPVFFGFISLNFPSGLVLYFFVSNLWRLGQQEVIFRRFGTAADPKHHRLKSPPRAGVVDAESRERAVAVEDAPQPEPKKNGAGAPEIEAGEATSAAATPAKAPKRNGTPAAGKPMLAPTPGGGLRGLFRPPPPATGAPVPSRPAKPAPKFAPKAAPKKTSTGAGASSRPGEAGRRTSKKKKKR
ncbi:MAG: membrane protein insertase YidC [Actinomycetota bacterium]